MATEVALKVTADGSQAEGSVKGIKQQLKEAQSEVLAMSEKFGATSTQAANAAKKAANLKDAIGDAKALTDVFSPDQKFAAFSGAIQGVVGGFQALQGAQALFGAESEEVQKIMMKLQAAMALSQGMSAITSSIDSFKNLGSVIKNSTIFQKGYQAATVAAAAVQKLFTGAVASTSVGFKALRAAIISTGIGALIVGVTMLISKIADWVGGTEDAEAAQKQFNKSIERQNELLEQSQNALNFERQLFEKRAKIQGLSQDQILKQQVDFNKKEVAILENDAKVKHELQIKAFKNDNINADTWKKAREEELKSSKALQEARNKVTLSQLDVDAYYADQQRSANQKANEDSKRAHEKKLADSKAAADKAKQQREQNQKEIEAANTAAANATKQLLDEIFIQEIKDEDQRAKAKLKQDYDNAVKEIEQSKASSNEKQKQLNALKKKFALDNEALDENIREKARDKETEAEKARLDAIIASIIDENQKKAYLIEVARQEEIDKQLDAYNKGLIDLQAYNNAVAGINAEFDKQQTELKKQIADNQVKIAEDQKNKELKILEEKQQRETEILKSVQDGVNFIKSVIDFNSQQITNRQQKENEIQKRLLDEQKISKEEYEKNVAAIDEKAEKRKRQLQRQSIIAENAMSIANIILNTLQANAKSIATFPLTGGQPWVTYNTVQGALGVATTIAQTAKALAALGGGGGASSQGASFGNKGGAPLSPQTTTTTLNQAQVNQMASATARAFVLESDVSGNQERIKRINRAARIN